MKNIILIAGDSWGQGEIDYYYNNTYPGLDNILHGGVGEYLTEYGYEVYNLSFPGGSNLQAVDRVRHFLNCNKSIADKTFHVVFFNTEWFREMWYFKKEQLSKHTQKGYCTIKKIWSEKPYIILAETSKQYNIPVSIIGGCGDTLYNAYEDLNIVCQSATNYIVNSNDAIDDPVLMNFSLPWTEPFLELVKPNLGLHDLEELTKDMELGNDRQKLVKDSHIFFEPDSVHPNRQGHLKLFNLLVEKLELQNLNQTVSKKEEAQNDGKQRSERKQTNQQSNGGTAESNRGLYTASKTRQPPRKFKKKGSTIFGQGRRRKIKQNRPKASSC